jgi:hypothetical protein
MSCELGPAPWYTDCALASQFVNTCTICRHQNAMGEPKVDCGEGELSPPLPCAPTLCLVRPPTAPMTPGGERRRLFYPPGWVGQQALRSLSLHDRWLPSEVLFQFAPNLDSCFTHNSPCQGHKSLCTIRSERGDRRQGPEAAEGPGLVRGTLELGYRLQGVWLHPRPSVSPSLPPAPPAITPIPGDSITRPTSLYPRPCAKVSLIPRSTISPVHTVLPHTVLCLAQPF